MSKWGDPVNLSKGIVRFDVLMVLRVQERVSGVMDEADSLVNRTCTIIGL